MTVIPQIRVLAKLSLSSTHLKISPWGMLAAPHRTPFKGAAHWEGSVGNVAALVQRAR